MRAGTVQIDQAAVLTSDPFSFTANGVAWRTQSWLADLLYGWGDRIWGLSFVIPLVLIGAALLVATIALRVHRVSPSPIATALGTVWIMWLTIGYFTPRPVLFSLMFFGLLLLAADTSELRWSLVPLIWLWASVHGGFVVGLGYLGLDGLRRKDWGRIADVVGATAITVLTAHGWGVWEIILKFFGSGQALDLIVEWLSPDFMGIEHFPFALGILALVAGAIRGRLQARDLWVIAPFLLFAFTANRAVPIAALALAPFFTGAVLNRARAPKSSTATRFQGRLNALLLASVFLLPALVPLAGGLDRELFAVEAIDHLGPERTFHDDGVGGYLIYAEWPDRFVYIDDRAELYGEGFVDFVQARAGHPVWHEVIEEFQIQQALLKVEDPLAQILSVAGWEERYRDERFVVLAEQGL